MHLCMYVHISIYMHVCPHGYMHMLVWAIPCVFVYVHVHAHTCMYMHMCMSDLVYVCESVWICYEYMYACVHVCVCTEPGMKE